MNDKTSNILFTLIKSDICGTLLCDEERASYDAELLPQLISVAKKHDVLHLLALGLKKNGLLDEQSKELEAEILKALYRYELLRYDYELLCAALEKNRIGFLPLKGSVLRALYPEPWMRTSCDIDILVREEELDRAKSVLTEELGYSFDGKGSHDISLFSPSRVHVELHYDLVEAGLANEASAVLKSVWDFAEPRADFEYWYELSDDIFYFYHVAHMAKHFENGGCGIRPFIDLLILDGIENADVEKRDALLERGKLLKFANAARRLSRVWFGDEAQDSVSAQMETYILFGGVYGNTQNRVMIHQQRQGGRVKYALSKIFIPYDVIKFHYPVLQKHRWLTPFMQVRRWCKLIFCGHLGRSARELQYNSDISKEEAASTRAFLENIGL